MPLRWVLTLIGVLECALQVYPMTENKILTAPRSCNVLHASWIGDGWCDNDDYNTPECNYDMGDCCQSTCNSLIHEDCGVAGYECKNPSAKENKLLTSKGWSGGGTVYGDGSSNFSNGSFGNQAGSSKYTRDSNDANNKGDHGDGSNSSGRKDSNSKSNGTHGDYNSAQKGNNDNNDESHSGAGNSDCQKCSDSGNADSTYCKKCNNGDKNGSHGDDGSADGQKGNNGDKNGSHGDDGSADGQKGNNGDKNGGHGDDGSADGQKGNNGSNDGAHGTDNGGGNSQKGNSGHDNGGHGDNGSADGQKGSNGNNDGAHGTDNGGGKDQNSGDGNGSHASDGDGNDHKGNKGHDNGGSRADDGGNSQRGNNGHDNGDHGNVGNGNSQNNNINNKVGTSAGGNGGQAYLSNFDLVFNAFNMSFDSSNQASVMAVEKTIASAMINNIVMHSSTAITSVKLAPYSSNGQLPQTTFALEHGSDSEKRILAGTLLKVMFAVTVSMQTQSSNVMSESLAMHQSIYNGLLQRSLRRTSKQSNVPALNWVRICRSNSPTICLAEHWLRIPRAQVQLDHCSMSTSDWDDLYERQAYYKGYVVWLSVLIILWVCLFAISSGPIIFLRFDLWPSFKICSSKSSGRLLDAARFNQGCAVAFMSVCRIVHLALIISISFDSKAPTYACVEFSFNRRSDGIISYSTPLLEVIQGIFYPIFLLAVLSRQEWYDAELRHIDAFTEKNSVNFIADLMSFVSDSFNLRITNVVTRTGSWSHLVVCFLLRRFLVAIALIFLLGQIITLMTISPKRQTEPTPASLSIWLRTSQISCTLFVIFIQLYHLKAICGVAAVHDTDTVTPQEGGKNDLLSNIEDGKKEVNGDDKKKSCSDIETFSRKQKLSDCDDDDNESKTDAEERGLVVGKRHSSRLSSHGHREFQLDNSKTISAVSDAAITPGNGDQENFFSRINRAFQMAAFPRLVVSDYKTWIVILATCICFLITAIPASLRSYLSAFLLYSLASRILEIAAASLLLSPFKIQNTSLKESASDSDTTKSFGHDSIYNCSATISGEREIMGKRKKAGRFFEFVG